MDHHTPAPTLLEEPTAPTANDLPRADAPLDPPTLIVYDAETVVMSPDLARALAAVPVAPLDEGPTVIDARGPEFSEPSWAQSPGPVPASRLAHAPTVPAKRRRLDQESTLVPATSLPAAPPSRRLSGFFLALVAILVLSIATSLAALSFLGRDDGHASPAPRSTAGSPAVASTDGGSLPQPLAAAPAALPLGPPPPAHKPGAPHPKKPRPRFSPSGLPLLR